MILYTNPVNREKYMYIFENFSFNFVSILYLVYVPSIIFSFNQRKNCQIGNIQHYFMVGVHF